MAWMGACWERQHGANVLFLINMVDMVSNMAWMGACLGCLFEPSPHPLQLHVNSCSSLFDVPPCFMKSECTTWHSFRCAAWHGWVHAEAACISKALTLLVC
eukprot:1161070-Pelagomonas_calceolata.AAC.3